MNQGLYGMASGGGASGGRKVIFRPARNDLLTTPLTAMYKLVGLPLNSLTPTANVRTKVASVSGKGAVRFALFEGTPSTASTITLELVVDGVVICTGSNNYADSSTGLVVAGVLGAQSGIYICVPDWIPFDSSAELYITQTVAIQCYCALVCELHQ